MFFSSYWSKISISCMVLVPDGQYVQKFPKGPNNLFPFNMSPKRFRWLFRPRVKTWGPKWSISKKRLIQFRRFGYCQKKLCSSTQTQQESRWRRTGVGWVVRKFRLIVPTLLGLSLRNALGVLEKSQKNRGSWYLYIMQQESRWGRTGVGWVVRKFRLVQLQNVQKN